MRTFNGLQIFTEQLTNSGQLDLRYVRISGNDQPANIYLGNLTQDYAFYSNTNFNIINSFNVSYNDTFQQYTGYMPELIDKKLITIKNLSSLRIRPNNYQLKLYCKKLKRFSLILLLLKIILMLQIINLPSN